MSETSKIEEGRKRKKTPKAQQDTEPPAKKRSTKKKSNTADEICWTTAYDDYVYKKSIDELSTMIVEQFLRVCDDKLDRQSLQDIVDFIREKYNPNHYHKFEHACHVLINTACLLQYIEPHCILTTVEKVAVLYAALIHDVDHLGVTNSTLVKGSHTLALQYHDQSVAENHSLSIGLGLLLDPPHDTFLSEFNEVELRKFRTFVIELVLSTDIADPYKKQLTYLKVKDKSTLEAGALDTTTDYGKIALLIMCLRIADVGSSVQSINTAETWAKNFYLELRNAQVFHQGPVVDPQAFYAQQVHYFEEHVQYILQTLQKTACLQSNVIEEQFNNYERNLQHWHESGRQQIDDWEKAHHEHTSEKKGTTSEKRGTRSRGKK